jgi:hypothetical protein
VATLAATSPHEPRAGRDASLATTPLDQGRAPVVTRGRGLRPRFCLARGRAGWGRPACVSQLVVRAPEAHLLSFHPSQQGRGYGYQRERAPKEGEGVTLVAASLDDNELGGTLVVPRARLTRGEPPWSRGSVAQW